MFYSTSQVNDAIIEIFNFYGLYVFINDSSHQLTQKSDWKQMRINFKTFWRNFD